MNNTVPLIITNGLIASETYDETIEGFTNLENVLNATTAIADGAHDPELAANAVQWALGTALKTVFSIAGFSPPANSTEIGDAAFESIDFSEGMYQALTTHYLNACRLGDGIDADDFWAPSSNSEKCADLYRCRRRRPEGLREAGHCLRADICTIPSSSVQCLPR